MTAYDYTNAAHRHQFAVAICLAFQYDLICEDGRRISYKELRAGVR